MPNVMPLIATVSGRMWQSRSLLRLSDSVAYNFISKNNAGSSQRGRLRMPKNDNVFRLKCDDEILAVAADGYLPAKGTIWLKSCGH
jgi:hypothetical protein